MDQDVSFPANELRSAIRRTARKAVPASLPYGRRTEIVPGLKIRFSDAGHILGSAIVELWLEERGVRARFAPFNEWIEYTDWVGHQRAEEGRPAHRRRRPDQAERRSLEDDADHRTPRNHWRRRRHRRL